MALGRQGERQADLMIGWAELPRSPGHAFYDRLQEVLVGAGFDRFAEGARAPYYASRRGRPSIPPGRYFRMHLVGYFEGIDSERGLEWRCADSLSLREFLRLGSTEPVPDHSWLSKTRARLPLEVHEAVFAWVLQRLAEHGLIEGGRIGVDASTMEANAALRAIAPRRRRGLPRDAGATGEGERDRDAHGRGPGPAGPEAERQAAVERGVDVGDRPRGQDRQAEGRPRAPGLQAGARGRPGHRRDRRGRGPPGRPGRHRDLAGDARGGRGQPGGGRRGPDPGRSERADRGQRVPLARRLEGSGRRGLEEPHRREEGGGCQSLFYSDYLKGRIRVQWPSG